ncbi:DEAD/DEAH box helicase [Corynebacterium bovis]|uniref:ATP-dependent RNA helicase HelY n=1 Tax=Corynebacterium bovis DSM 20582 = CIP 54.80 TaxID=927655 RepID=A0A8H9Y6C0_9CORY|nr:DEAD/DEAH box helicase [Corynebacterium bovis]MBB3115220.1 ATP-dependent RNA helicase HelY [Corynebacterium bovis DSM 20582 = CIP 54.80]QQC47832.1 DEAD/DEAH box helicase [Corynebacterium bovis]RRO79548.1 DEAD/DEAH box helicase [Corynebacterium bovis]RRO80851.1 DEAD/DEAH box helicase [Corynebacterium bovis]RRO82247.1 DEAD/DEAH box helicase [Corynebacterium bovis]
MSSETPHASGPPDPDPDAPTTPPTSPSPDAAATAPTVAAFREHYGFPLDAFQVEAVEAVDAGRSVLVCAPTGAGKTVVGEFAVFTALRHGGTCFYTTPIKALSNQKYHDLVARYGEADVGLLTGDVSVNGDAPVVVMTTEVLRNMIYSGSPRLDSLTHVVMDEVHFLADRSRGPVWEEAILTLDPRVLLVSLSATVSNAEEFGGWLRTVRGDTDIVVTTHRPVPLHQHLMVGTRVLPLFTGDTDDLGAVNRAAVAAAATAEKQGRRRGTKRSDAVMRLRGDGMLPAIYFIFSRAGCDGAVRQLLVDRIDLVTPEQREEILRTVDAGVDGIGREDLGILGFRQWRRALSHGFAAHHAGMLPAFRHIVEDLFSRGLVKVCFATETLALGINMPARSVVLEKLVKYNGEAHVDLTPAQYTQLTGRAGRRGTDTVGHAVVLWSPGMDPYAVADLASTRSYPLDSTFRPGYNMAVNLIATKGYDDAHRILERSFAQYQIDGTVVERAEQVERRRRDLDEARRALEAAVGRVAPPAVDGTDAVEELLDYAELRRLLSHEERRAKRTAGDERRAETTAMLADRGFGDIIVLPTGRDPDVAVVVRPDGNRRDPRPWIVTEDGWCGPVSADVFRNVPLAVGHMALPRGAQKSPRRLARSVAATLRRQHVDKPRSLKVTARGSTRAASDLRDRVHTHPVHAWPDREQLVAPATQLLKARRRLDHELGEAGPDADTLGRTFDRILDLLRELDYVDGRGPDTAVTVEGQRLARVHHESDLLVAQCLRRGVWDHLDPAELAAAVSTCVFEIRREVPVAGAGPGLPTEPLTAAVEDVIRIHRELTSDEERHRLPVTRPPEPAFAAALHQWTAGAPLDYCLRAAEAAGAPMTPGDFVRWCRRVTDLLSQITQTGYSDEVRAGARAAARALNRGVVAVGA